MSELPQGWELVQLGSVGTWGSGGTPKRTNEGYYAAKGIPWLVIGDLTDGLVVKSANSLTELGLQNSSAKLLPIGTLLVAMYGSIGKLGITGIECATNQAIAFCRPNEAVVSLRYLYHALFDAKPRLLALGQGGAQQNISQSVLKEFQIALAPKNEQTRIANQLDTLLARVRACNDRFDAIPALLKRFRQTVLRAAITGALTTASDWQICKIKDAGKIQLGRQRAPKFHTGKNMRPYLRVQNVFENRLDLSDVMEMDFPGADFERYELHPGDILLNEGQSPEYLGRPAMYRGELPGACFTNTLIRFQAYSNVNPEFALLVFRHHMHSGRYIVEGNITTNLAHLSAGRFGEVEFPLPTLEEQTEIVRRVEALFAMADRIEARCTAARTQAQRLTPLVLAKAFRGELVQQDPNDEPASALLARIASSNTAVAGANKRKTPVTPKERAQAAIY